MVNALLTLVGMARGIATLEPDSRQQGYIVGVMQQKWRP